MELYMKERLKVIALIIVILAAIGCGSKENKETEKKIDENTVVLEGISYTLDQDDEGYGIKYKVASNFRKTELINAINYFSENINDQAYFVIRLFHYNNKSIDYVIKDIAPSYDDKRELKINDLDYTFIHFINYTEADVNIYIHKHDKYTYAITFTSHIDMTKLEDLFLKSIDYEPNK